MPVHITLPAIHSTNGNYSRSINELLSQNAADIHNRLICHGAVLFRGFDIQSERDFEQAVTSMPGMRAMELLFHV